MTGFSGGRSWKKGAMPFDVFDLKGVLETLFERISCANWDFVKHNNPCIKNRGLAIIIAGKETGWMGEIATEILNEFEIEQPVFAFELDYDVLLENILRHQQFQPIQKYPAVRRDLALLVKEDVEAASLSQVIEKSGGPYLQDIDVFDVFTGKQVGQGLKSIAFSFTFYSTERTLTEQEVDKQITTILNKLSEAFSARLRN
jgi:phenylalanyl-tRNA synthetase beta chain